MSGADASRRERAVSSTGAGAPASAERSSKLGDDDREDIRTRLLSQEAVVQSSRAR